jgi:ATP-dependent RNA helicase SUPV3L1/SUV3
LKRFHAGATNSGKTYSALQRLKRSRKGMYLAPLRLLAAEAYENLNAEGVYTSLLTGQEKCVVPFATHRSSTVELASLEEDFDVVVIDEIQMMR